MGRINESNFPVFRKLIEEVFLKATGKKIEKINEKIGDDIADIIKCSVGGAPGGKSLNNYINAVLLNDFTKHPVNPEYRTLNMLANYVLKNAETPESGGEKGGSKNSDTGWINFEKKYAFLISQSNATETAEGIKKMDTEKPENISIDISPSTETPLKKDFHFTAHDKKKFISAGIRGGIYAGILASLTIVLLRYLNDRNTTPLPTGYENVSFDSFMHDIFTPLLLFQIIAGAFLGYFCCYTAASNSKVSKNLLLFILSFVVIVILRQCMARDAWVLPGTRTYIDQNGHVRSGGGILGEPDFETLATGFMGAFVILLLVRAFRKNRLIALVKKDTLVLIIKSIICGIVAWGCMYGIYIILVERLQLIDKGDYLVDPSIFIVDFPHPERPVFAMAIYLIYVLSFLFSIRYHYYNGRQLLL
jgi:hypothetical protein